MQFQITQAGLQAAATAGQNGYKLVLGRYKLGSAVGYTPVPTDTGLHGTLLHTGVFTGYYVINANQVQYLIVLDESVGDFDFGEVSLELENGTCFALGTLTALQRKSKTNSNQVGNRITIEAKMTLTQLAAILEFPILNITNAKFLEASSVDVLYPPVSMDTNAYLTLKRDAAEQAVICYRADYYRWSIPSFQRVVAATVSNNGRGYTNASVNLIGGTALPQDAATATAVVSNGSVTAINVTNWGKNYVSEPEVTVSGDGYGATGKAKTTKGVYQINVVNQGTGYTTPPAVQVVGLGTGATATATVQLGKVTSITVTNCGKDYTTVPDVIISGGGGSGATAVAQTTTLVYQIDVAQNTATNLLCGDLFSQLEDVVGGKYIVQFITGDLKGLLRHVTAAGASSIDWDSNSPTGTPPKSGDLFEVYACTALLLSDLNTKLNKNYGVVTPVVVCGTKNVSLLGLQTIDGLALANGDRVLLVGQTSKATNGVWIARAGNWERPSDFNSSLNVTQGLLVPVIAGVTNKSGLYSLTTRGTIQVGSTLLDFENTQKRHIQRVATSAALTMSLSLS